MSLVTRCPACATAFKVVRDQLRISEGWVRCGRCNEVFDATLDLQESDGDAIGGQAASPSPAAVPSSGSTPMAAAASPASEPLAPVLSPPPDVSGAAEVGPDGPAHEELEVDGPQATPEPVAPPPMAWPAPNLLDIGAAVRHSERPLAAESAAGPAAPMRQEHDRSPASGAEHATASRWHAPVDLPNVVADDPWPMRAASAPADAEAQDLDPSPVDAAVNAQLQKALRRTRIQALRESRARERAAAREEQASASEPQGGAAAEASPMPAVPPATGPEAPAAWPENPLRQASDDALPVAVPAAAPAPEVPSFLDAPVPAEDAPDGHRAAWLTFVLLAALVLVLQVLRHERDALAASQPAWRPVLATLCQLSGCELSAARRIDAVRIDGSSFTPGRDEGAYRLAFSLRNAAATPLAMPAIELSLLDGNERPVVRRVFQPAEFGAPVVLAPRAEQSATLSLFLKMPDGGGLPPVVGYSMLAFYP